MRWKRFFYFTRSERQGIILLIVLIVLVGVSSFFIPPREASFVKDETFEKEYAAFKNSLQQQKRERQATSNKRFQQRTVILRPFDPNTTDSIGFLELGLPPWMAKNILHYRAKGGKFRKPEDLKKIYGLTEQQYATLLPYLSIAESVEDKVQLYVKQAKDTLLPVKHPIGTLVSLNQADTTELKIIPGVGSAIARMIVGYRKQLGGFYKVDQLAEIRLNVDSLRSWFTVGPGETRPINLNKASVELLKRHPYLNFYQAKTIVEHRKKKGALTNLQQLKFYEEFTPDDLKRIAPYVCFK